MVSTLVQIKWSINFSLGDFPTYPTPTIIVVTFNFSILMDL
jgi:hypothetical protein